MMRSLILSAFLPALILLATAAAAQIPPHRPGDICITPQGWCWANPPGPPGSPCSCGGPQGTRG